MTKTTSPHTEKRLRRRAATAILRHMHTGLDIKAASIKAASAAKAEALGEGWTTDQANHLGVVVARVGADIAVTLTAHTA